MGKIISISNHKGGVGKTTTAINLGAGLSRLGKKVLLVDIDPQANLTQSLGKTDQGRTIYGALRGDYDLPEIEIAKNLYLIPSSLDLTGAEVELEGKAGRYKLKGLIDPLRGSYDFILIDTPPSLGLLTINALTASQEIIIPLQAQYLAVQGLTKLIEIIESINNKLNKDLKLGGVLITQYDKRKVLHRSVDKAIRDHLKTMVFKTKIRDNIALAEAPSKGVDIFTYQAKSYGAEDYLALSKEIIKKEKQGV